MIISGNMRDGAVDSRPVDLHVHSNASDGTMTPSELVDYSIKKGLSAIALTDHDTVAGLAEIKDCARRTPGAPEIISGVELSTDIGGKDIHIVGLFIDETKPDFLKEITEFRESRDLRNVRMCEGLRDGLGMDISYEKLKEAFPGSVITRGHYAKYMLRKGYVQTMQEAFERWIGDGGPYFIPREKVTPSDGIRLIKKAGGVPVLAHPLQYGWPLSTLEEHIEAWKEDGLAAMEVLYTTFSPEDTAAMKALADRQGLLYSGGSDFHGTNKVNTDLGTGRGNLSVPSSVLEALRAYHQGQ